MENVQPLKQMILDQFNLNTKIAGSKMWVFNINPKTAKPTNWADAFVNELAELQDSLNLKAWKEEKIDLVNARVELSDMFHFLISEVTKEVVQRNMEFLLDVYNFKQDDTKETVDHLLTLCRHERLEVALPTLKGLIKVIHIYDYEGQKDINDFIDHIFKFSISEIVDKLTITRKNALIVNGLVAKSLLDLNNKDSIGYLLVTLSTLRLNASLVASLNQIGEVKPESYDESIEEVVTKMEMFKIFLSIPDFTHLYKLKRVLNKFRSNNGYAEGHYIKMWNGKEDNAYLMEEFSERSDVDEKEIYSFLQNTYNRILANESSEH